MTFEALKENIRREKEIIKEMYSFLNQIDSINSFEINQGGTVSVREKRLLGDTINHLANQLRIMNNSMSEIINNIPFFKKLPIETKVKKNEKLVNVKYKPSEEEEHVSVTIDKAEKAKFLESLALSKFGLEKLRKGRSEKKLTKADDFRRASKYAKISNKFFREVSNNLISKGYFNSLNKALRRITSQHILNTYVSMILFSSVLALIFGIFVYIFSLFFSLSISFPFLIPVTGSILMSALKNIWLIIIFPVVLGVLMYYFPFSEKKNIEGKINQELPFVVINMSAIVTSNIEPSKIFEIIIASEDYPHTAKEIKKLLNQINFYGYDLSTSLKNSAMRSPSKKLGELFNGLATAISSGGDLKNFLSEHAEGLLFDYRLEREKYTKTAETFMNIYISVVIAAPMIIMILFVVMNMTGMTFYGLSIKMLSFLIIFGIAILNVIFIIFLQLKQPGY